jgi:hypothetical protein
MSAASCRRWRMRIVAAPRWPATSTKCSEAAHFQLSAAVDPSGIVLTKYNRPHELDGATSCPGKQRRAATANGISRWLRSARPQKAKFV